MLNLIVPLITCYLSRYHKQHESGYSFNLAAKSKSRISISDLSFIDDTAKEVSTRSPIVNSSLIHITTEMANSVVGYQEKISCFLSPLEYEAIMNSLSKRIDVSAALVGFPSAVRMRILFRNSVNDEDEQILIEESKYIVPVRIEGNFMFDKASTEDYLQALRDVGIQDTEIGDVLNPQGENGATVVMTPEAADRCTPSLKRVRSVTVSCSKRELTELIRPIVAREVTSIEASSRLDALGSAGLKISRTKMVKLVEEGFVSINHKLVFSPAQNLHVNDVVTVTGFGKLTVLEAEVTQKGRYRVKLRRTS